MCWMLATVRLMRPLKINWKRWRWSSAKIRKKNSNDYNIKVMAEIKPEEVSAILREQLSQSRTSAQLEEVERCLPSVTVGAYLRSYTGAGRWLLVLKTDWKALMYWTFEEDNVGAVLLGESKGIREGDTVKTGWQIGSIKKLVTVCWAV